MKHFILSALLGLMATVLYSQEISYKAADIPESLLRYAHYITRLDQTIIAVDKKKNLTIQSRVVRTILNEQGDDESKLLLFENDFYSVKKMEGRLFDQNGQLIRKSSKNDIQTRTHNSEYEMTDARQKMLDLSYNQYPYTVEFLIAIKASDFFLFPSNTIQHLGEAVEQGEYTLMVPSDYVFDWKIVGSDTAFKKKSDDGKQAVWTYSVKNLPAPADEKGVGFRNKIYSELLIAPASCQFETFEGSTRTWADAGAFFYKINQNRDELVPEMAAFIQTLVAGTTSTREKIDKLYQYLQKNHRYVSIQLGIGGWQTHEANAVAQKKYGDCKALSNFMKAMLKAVNIPSYQALVYAGGDAAPIVYPDFPTPLFNHVVLYIPGEDMWLECTSNQCPMGYMGDFTAGRPALLLTPDGGKLTTIPALDASLNQRTTVSDINISVAGHADIQSTFKYTGNLHDPYRTLAQEKDIQRHEKYLSESLGISVTAIHKTAVSASPNKAEAQMEADLESRNYAKASGKRLFIPINRLKPVKISLPQDTARQHPLILYDAYMAHDTIHFHIPAGFAKENMPAPVQIESPYGKYSLQITEVSPLHFTAVRHLEIVPVSAPAPDYEKVRKFYLDISKADTAQMVFVKVD